MITDTRIPVLLNEVICDDRTVHWESLFKYNGNSMILKFIGTYDGTNILGILEAWFIKPGDTDYWLYKTSSFTTTPTI